jgi:hypothetical protein
MLRRIPAARKDNLGAAQGGQEKFATAQLPFAAPLF